MLSCYRGAGAHLCGFESHLRLCRKNDFGEREKPIGE